MRRLLIALLLITAACGQAPAQAGASPVAETPTPSATATESASPSPSPTASPTTSPKPASPTTSPKPGPLPSPKTSATLLFAVLEAKGTANAWTYNTVAIAGLDGYARAKATFTPMPVPTLGCIGAVLPRSAHVAAGKVFYSDAKGVVRSLSIDGTVSTAATFPLTSSQQMLSFAVSPDGSRLMGAVFTVPAKPNIGCSSSPGTGYSLDVYAAAVAGPRTLLYHRSLPSPPGSVLAFTGWDNIGPVGTYPTVWATQGGGPASELGVAVRIDAITGRVLRQFSDPSKCLVWDSVRSGAFVCTLDPVPTSSDPWGPLSQPVIIRNVAGQQEWRFTVTSVNGAWSPFLAPDEQHVVICCNFDTSQVWLVDRQGHKLFLSKGFYGSGWLDATTVVGHSGQTSSSPAGTLAYVALSSPGVYVSMGFSGLFVGTVRN